ncbi:MAG: hypothetical protein M0Z54_02310 [Thermaerobacter sp.]|nr:hypothetical protein [Thermaerobacter sp.]
MNSRTTSGIAPQQREAESLQHLGEFGRAGCRGYVVQDEVTRDQAKGLSSPFRVMIGVRLGSG